MFRAKGVFSAPDQCGGTPLDVLGEAPIDTFSILGLAVQVKSRVVS